MKQILFIIVGESGHYTLLLTNKERRERELMDMDNSVVIVCGGVHVELGIGGINSDGKNKNKEFENVFLN